MQAEQFIRHCGYRITEGSKFLWDCYGPDAWFLDAENGAQAVVDGRTGQVYEISLTRYAGDLNYRWIDPLKLDAYVNEATAKGFDAWQAYDDVRFVQIADVKEIREMLDAMAERTV